MAATSDDEPEEHSPRDVSAPHGGYPGYPTETDIRLFLATICIYQMALQPLSVSTR